MHYSFDMLQADIKIHDQNIIISLLNSELKKRKTPIMRNQIVFFRFKLKIHLKMIFKFFRKFTACHTII